ncbi:hypothetical protein CONPUDRAFT_66230, partial [Coniophora puteana RWD-64-598 SS2]
FPDTKVSLDLWHFVMRYSGCIVNTTRNPRQKEVAACISSCIVAQKADGASQHAVYRSKEEQERRLVEAFEYFERVGGIWGRYASKVHAEQLQHVRKGCLARPRNDIASDGSRIEGSHKGWNTLNRAQPSGIETMSALCHDFVLRRNIRIASRLEDRSTFIQSTFGSHHVHFTDYVARLWNQTCIETKSTNLLHLPILAKVDSNEAFGLVPSNYFLSFGGNIEVKIEESLLLDSDLSGDSAEQVTESALTNLNAGSDNTIVSHYCFTYHNETYRLTTTSPALRSITRSRCTPQLGVSASATGSRAATPSSQPSEVTRLPPLPPGLTRSEHFFSISTGIDARALRIEGDAEFYLFMDMRAEFKWQSYNMSPRKWVPATDVYNSRLRELNRARQIPTIAKHPQALLRKLGDIERSVLDRIHTKNFTCKYLLILLTSQVLLLTFLTAQRNTETFWKHHCQVIQLVKEESADKVSRLTI